MAAKTLPSVGYPHVHSHATHPAYSSSHNAHGSNHVSSSHLVQSPHALLQSYPMHPVGLASMHLASAQHAQLSTGPPDPEVQNLSDWYVALDRSERERMRQDCLDNIDRIEREFRESKESIFGGLLAQVTVASEAAALETHDKFRKMLKMLEAQRDMRIWLAAQWRQHQDKVAQHNFTAELQALDRDYENALADLQSKYRALDDDPRKLLEEETRQFLDDLPAGKGVSLRTLRRRGRSDRDGATGDRPTGEPPASIAHTLGADEISVDIHVIQTMTHLPRKHQRVS
jgi:hypothetical protein